MQPSSGDRFIQVGTVGTNVIASGGINLNKIILGGTYVGSVEWYDTATAAGTAASNLIYNVGLPLTNAYRSIDLNIRLRSGLVCVQTGTPLLTYTVS